jgi:hypothetical protein
MAVRRTGGSITGNHTAPARVVLIWNVPAKPRMSVKCPRRKGDSTHSMEDLSILP